MQVFRNFPYYSMGRTYKRNDTYKSNRAKSLREKRNKPNEVLTNKNYQRRTKKQNRFNSSKDYGNE